jgi:hypothetical protein
MSTILGPVAITTAVSIQAAPAIVYQFKQRSNGVRTLTLQGKLTYGSGGTTIDVYVVTSFDGGQVWIDVGQFHFTTASAVFAYNLSALTPVTTEYAVPAAGTLSANTAQDGLIGNLVGVLCKSTGTYAGTTLQIDAHSGDRIVPLIQ